MEYQLDLLQALSAMIVVNGNAFGTVVFIFFYIGLPVLVCLIPRRFMPYRIFKVLVVFVLMVSFIMSLMNVWGSGWKINDDFLHMESYGFLDDIKISSMEIGFVKADGGWRPDFREPGATNPGLSSGRYRLENRKKALVFNHFRQNKLLLISADQKYYLIGHPGIEKLYDKLLSLGAKEKGFE